MGAPIIAVVERPKHRSSGATSIQADHVTQTNHPLLRFGNAGISPAINYGAFAGQGRIHPNPGSHENHYFNIRSIQSIRQRFMGGVPAKMFYPKRITQPLGAGPGGDHARANVDKPQPLTLGDLATVSGTNRERIRTHLR